MILDFEYLPLPAMPGPEGRAPAANAKGNRAAQFTMKDTNKDGKLSFEEFSAGRAPDDAKKWFELRDANRDGFLSREEFIPTAPQPKMP
jgi:hypothetical protein